MQMNLQDGAAEVGVCGARCRLRETEGYSHRSPPDTATETGRWKGIDEAVHACGSSLIRAFPSSTRTQYIGDVLGGAGPRFMS